MFGSLSKSIALGFLAGIVCAAAAADAANNPDHAFQFLQIEGPESGSEFRVYHCDIAIQFYISASVITIERNATFKAKLQAGDTWEKVRHDLDNMTGYPEAGPFEVRWVFDQRNAAGDISLLLGCDENFTRCKNDRASFRVTNSDQVFQAISQDFPQAKAAKMNGLER